MWPTRPTAAGWRGRRATPEGSTSSSTTRPPPAARPPPRRRPARAARDLGGLDVLLNNASTLGAAPLPPLAEYPLDVLEEAFRVNVLAPLALTREGLPLLANSGGAAGTGP